MKKTTGYSINHNDMTITLTKAYMEKSSVPGTKEFRELVQLHKSFPDYHIVRRTAEIRQNKETHKGLTYDLIEKAIAYQANSEELLREYHEFVKFYGREVVIDKKSGKTEIRAPYGKTKAWFLKNVPNYTEIDFTLAVKGND